MTVYEFLPPGELLLPFLVAAIALNLTPGADMTFVALSGARGGKRAGLAAACGVFAGCIGHIVFAVIGLSALIMASQTAFAVVKWAGVAYLVYIAIQLLRDEGGPAPSRIGGDVPLTPRAAFRQAALINLLNPKVGIFFLAFLPQFVAPDAAAPALQILAMGLLFDTSGLVVNSVVGLSSAAAARKLGGSRWIRRGARWFAATVMGGLAVKLAISRSS